jgi:protein SCO1/2
MRARGIVIVAAVAAMGGAYSGPPVRSERPPDPPKVGIDQHLGVRVPLDLPFKNETGGRVRLGDCTAGKPTILVLAYFRCPMLCTQVLNGLLDALRAMPETAGDRFNVVVVSFDPREKPPLAAVKKAAYLEEYSRPGAERGWHFLTGDPLAINTLADTVGFRKEYDSNKDQYAHGSGIMILADDGTITRYLYGVRFEPRDVKLALTEASDGMVGSPADQVLLLCYQYDPATGKYTPAIMRFVRLGSALTVLALGGLVGVLWWRGHRRAATREVTP